MSEANSKIEISGKMGSASEPTHPASEREILYRATMANYRPPVTLRTNHKRLRLWYVFTKETKN